MIDFRDLVKAGVHFGHQKSRWSPKMAPYIWGFKNNIHLIDISKTARQLKKASDFLKNLAAEGKTVLWIGTKRPSQEVIYEVASKLKMPYVNHRWIGGTLSNFSQVKKSITKLLHFEDVIARAQKFPHYTKKELNTFQKLVERLEKNIGGIRQLRWPIGAVVVVDVKREQAAVREASRMGIPVVAMVDTNSDPSLVDYIIPANDDAPRSISLIINYLGQGAEEGLKEFEKKKAEKEKKEEVAKKEVKEKEAPKKAVAAKSAKREEKKKETGKTEKEPPATKRTEVKKIKSAEAKKTDTKSTTKKKTTKKPTTKSGSTSTTKTAKSKKK